MVQAVWARDNSEPNDRRHHNCSMIGQSQMSVLDSTALAGRTATYCQLDAAVSGSKTAVGDLTWRFGSCDVAALEAVDIACKLHIVLVGLVEVAAGSPEQQLQIGT